jgi:hypothetical protein
MQANTAIVLNNESKKQERNKQKHLFSYPKSDCIEGSEFPVSEEEWNSGEFSHTHTHTLHNQNERLIYFYVLFQHKQHTYTRKLQRFMRTTENRGKIRAFK